MENIDKTSVSSCDNEEEEIPFTSTAELNLIKPYDSTVEVVGYVDGIESSRIEGQHNHKIFKFFINNGQSERIQIIAWNKEILRVEDRIRTDEANTVINVLGKYDIENKIPSCEAELVELAEIAVTTKCMKTQGYIKSNFAIVERQKNGGVELCCGSITDGVYKLEVRTTADLYDLELVKGEKIEITGFFRRNAVPVHLLARSVTDFKRINSKKVKLSQLLRGNETVELKKTTQASDLPGPSAKRTKL